MIFDNKEKFLDYIKTIQKKKDIFIWGSGIYGNLIGIVFNENNIVWNGYIDNYPFVGMDNLNGKNINPAKEVDLNADSVYILSMKNYSEVCTQLHEKEISNENIIWFESVDFFYQLDLEYGKFGTSESEKIKKLKNIYKNDSCFIIGNGPSLLLDDLNLLNNKGCISFGCNHIYRCFEKTLWRPDYYFFIDFNGLNACMNDEIKYYINNDVKFFFTRVDAEIDKGIIKDKVIFLNQVFSKSEDKIDFSDDCSVQTYMGYSVSYSMIQVAVYMGFKEIYLLGMDHDFPLMKDLDGKTIIEKNKKIHSDILGNYKWSDTVVDLRPSTLAFQSAKKYADEHGIKIYNATRGGKLEVFERVNFDDIFV